MGKKKKKQSRGQTSPKKQDSDATVFLAMSQELKDEGNRLFQRRNYEGAMAKYEKALKLLPKSHIDVSYIHSNIAACYMQMGRSKFSNAVRQCDLALEVTPNYSKALLKRARCYEAMNRLYLALRDTTAVLDVEPDNMMAVEVAERVRKALEERGLKVTDAAIELPPDYVEPESMNRKPRRKRGLKKPSEDTKKAKDKAMVGEEEEENEKVLEVSFRNVKLVFGEDIRWARLTENCSLGYVGDIVQDRFPGLGSVLVKYRDQEGDLVTITTDGELWWAEASGDPQNVSRLYLIEVDPAAAAEKTPTNTECSSLAGTATCVEDWVLEFAPIFKKHAGLDPEEFPDLCGPGYSESMEETVTSEAAQSAFETAAESFREMTALVVFNCGNVHTSRARKGIYMVDDDCNDEALLFESVTKAYEYVIREYKQAGTLYEEALKIKPDLHEAYLALGQEQFEEAKLSWCYAVGNGIDLEMWPSTELLQLYNAAERNIEKGVKLWEESEETRRRPDDLSEDDFAERVSDMRRQINLMWGTMLYERSIVEFKLGLPVWSGFLEVAAEKFELAGASRSEIAALVTNHCSNNNAVAEASEVKIDEVAQAWTEMYEVKRWQNGVPSYRLESLLRGRLHHAPAHA